MNNRLFDKRVDNFFRVENAIFERDDLTAHEKLVYILLCRYANTNDGAFPSYETIAKKCSISRATAIRVVKTLLDKQLIEKEVRFKGKSQENTSNLYYVCTALKESEPKESNRVDDDKSGSVIETPPSITQTPHVVSHRYPIKNNIKKNNIKKTTTVVDSIPKEVVQEYKDKIKTTISDEVSDKAVIELIQEQGVEKIDKYLDNWNNFDLSKIKSNSAFFVSAVKDAFAIPVKKNTNDNRNNFTERQYSDDFMNSLYANTGDSRIDTAQSAG